MKRILICLLVAGPVLASAQATGLSTPVPFGSFGFINGKNTYSRPDNPDEGNYMFPKDPTTAKVVLRNGRVYTGVKVMLNLMDNQMIFMDSTGQLYESISQVASIEFPPSETVPAKTVFQTGFPPMPPKMDYSSYYEVLVDGPVMLLKANQISYIEKNVLGKSDPVRVYDNTPILFAYDKKTNEMKKVTKSSQADIFAGNAKMQSYLGSHKIKSQADIVGLFNYYNSIQ